MPTLSQHKQESIANLKQGPEHILFLDHLRGVAIIFVLLIHSFSWTFWPIYNEDQLRWSGWVRDLHAPLSFLALWPASLGWSGVSIFFVVSGFCIHLSHARSSQKGFGTFFTRRFFRIYPPYLLAFLFFAFVFPQSRLGLGLGFATHHWNGNLTAFKETVAQVLTHVFLVQNFSRHYCYAVSDAFWSIAVEVQLYALYPLLYWLAMRVGWLRVLYLTGMFELGLRGLESILSLLPHPAALPEWISGSPLFYWYSWSVGATLADAYLKGTPLPFRNFSLRFWPLVFLLSYSLKPLAPFCFTLAAVSTVYLIADLLSRPNLNLNMSGIRGLILNGLRWTGIISYSTYLIHEPILSYWHDHLPGLFARLFHWHTVPLTVTFISCISFCTVIIVLSYPFYRHIELPSIAWGKRILQKAKNSPRSEGGSPHY